MTKRINQKNPADCVVCCLAMYLGTTYKELLIRYPCLVERITNVRQGGVNLYEEQLMIFAATGKGMIHMQIHYDWDNTRQAEVMEMLAGKKAILSVRSLNVEDAAHAVFWDGNKVLDPSNKKRYTKATVRPYNIMF